MGVLACEALTSDITAALINQLEKENKALDESISEQLRLKQKNQLDKLKKFIPPKDYSKMMPSPKMMSTSLWALEQIDQEEKIE